MESWYFFISCCKPTSSSILVPQAAQVNVPGIDLDVGDLKPGLEVLYGRQGLVGVPVPHINCLVVRVQLYIPGDGKW